MKKEYVQPEAELLSLASLEDFLNASTGYGGDTGDGDDFNGDKWE